ncbi:MAG: hypothetical protein HIU82_00935 [Proteobacteria bacterium]|nr:hypothetical protein [Pseudomonadota bacterium]
MSPLRALALIALLLCAGVAPAPVLFAGVTPARVRFAGVTPARVRFAGVTPARILFAGVTPARAAPEAPCPPDPPGLVPAAPLAAFAAALRPGATVDLLAVGSASTVAADGYATAMLAALQAARPGVTFRLTQRGGRGQDAATTLRLLATALAAGRYPLVVWQAGTVDAVRGLQPDDLASTLDAGADLTRRHGADLVLVDPQFSRFLRANVDIEPYETALQMAAAEPQVSLFPRYELMQGWADDDGPDPERATTTRGQHAAAVLLRRCVGAALARFMLAGAAK